MPRVADCLSARQELVEDQGEDQLDGSLDGSCPAGCRPESLCPSPPSIPSQLDEPRPVEVDQVFEEEVDETVVEEDSTYDDEEDVDLDVDYVDYEDVNYDNVIDNSGVSEDTITARKPEDEAPDSSSVPNILTEEVLTEEPEDVEEVDVNIDSGFLTDSEGEAVELLPRRVVKPLTGIPAIFVFLVIGGVDTSRLPCYVFYIYFIN